MTLIRQADGRVKLELVAGGKAAYEETFNGWTAAAKLLPRLIRDRVWRVALDEVDK